MIIGNRLRQLRDNKNFTQEEFAARLEINCSTLAKYEAGQSMGLEILCRICKELDTTPDYLLGYKDDNTSYKKNENSCNKELIVKVLSIDDKILRKVTEVIDQQIGNPLFSVEMLTDEMAMSPVQLYRKVKWLTGNTPNELIRNMRLERAASLMDQQVGSIKEIAYRVGFQNMSYFAKCFRQKFDKTPSEFMKP